MARPQIGKKKEEPRALYGVYRNGKRIYLPPRHQVGIDLERAKQVAAALPDAEIVCLYDPEQDEQAA